MVPAMSAPDVDDIAARIIAANRYMTLATADAAGRPWSSPVYYAAVGPGELLWVSRPEARHSRNVAVRPEVGISIFDSNAAIGTGQGAYLEAVAEQLAGDAAARGIAGFSRVSLDHGARAWSLADVEGDAELRLYRAVAGAGWILEPGGRDIRVPVAFRAGA